MITSEDAVEYTSVIKNKTHSEEVMMKRYDVPSGLDFSTFALVDHSVLASKLGALVETIEFFGRTDAPEIERSLECLSTPCEDRACELLRDFEPASLPSMFDSASGASIASCSVGGNRPRRVKAELPMVP